MSTRADRENADEWDRLLRTAQMLQCLGMLEHLVDELIDQVKHGGDASVEASILCEHGDVDKLRSIMTEAIEMMKCPHIHFSCRSRHYVDQIIFEIRITYDALSVN